MSPIYKKPGTNKPVPPMGKKPQTGGPMPRPGVTKPVPPQGKISKPQMPGIVQAMKEKLAMKAKQGK